MPGPKAITITTRPVTIPQKLIVGAQQSPLCLAMIWLGTAINNSTILPRNNHFIKRLVKLLGSQLWVKRKNTHDQISQLTPIKHIPVQAIAVVATASPKIPVANSKIMPKRIIEKRNAVVITGIQMSRLGFGLFSAILTGTTKSNASEIRIMQQNANNCQTEKI